MTSIDSPHPAAAPGDGRLKAIAPYLVIVAIWAMVSVGTVFVSKTPVTNGELFGPDAYMRLVRVTELAKTGDWYNGTIKRSNAPYGETLHWTRPFDVVLLTGAAVIAPFTGFKTALFWWGSLVSPLFLLLTCFGIVWAAAPLVKREGVPLPVVAVIIPLFQPLIVGYAVPGRPDHHAALFFLFIVTIGATLRAVLSDKDTRMAVLGGVAGGLGLWASVELLVAVVICLVGLGLAWLRDGALRGAGGGAGRARQNVAYAAGLLAVVGVALVLDRPLATILSPTYDRISSVHLLIAAVVFLFWVAVFAAETRRLAPGRLAGRLLIGALGVFAVGAALYLVFPKFFAGSMADVDPRIVQIWLYRVAEMQPTLPTSSAKLGRFVGIFGLGLICVPLLIWMIVKERGRPQWLGWVWIAFGLAVVMAVALRYIRFGPYAEILFALVVVEFVGRLIAWTERFRRDLAGAFVRVTVLVAMILGPLAGDAALTKRKARGSARTAAASCSLPGIAAYLDAREATPKTVLAFIDHGPELLYRTKHAVIGSPYHRNNRGIYDSYRTFATTDTAEARSIVNARRVDFVLLCMGGPEAGLFSEKGMLYRRLVDGRGPSWLRPVDLPQDLGRHFRLFAVVAR